MASDLAQAIVSGAIPGLTLAAIGAMMAMRHDKSAMVDGKKVLAYGIGMKLLGTVALAMTIGAAVSPVVAAFNDPARLSHPLDLPALTILVWLLAWVFGLLPWEVFFRGLSYDELGVYSRTLFRGRRFAPWSDVTEYRDNGFNSPFLRLKQGTKIKIWKFRDGFPEFIGFLKARQIPGSQNARLT